MTSKEFIFLSPEKTRMHLYPLPSPSKTRFRPEPSNIDTCQKNHHSLLPFHSATYLRMRRNYTVLVLLFKLMFKSRGLPLPLGPQDITDLLPNDCLAS